MPEEVIDTSLLPGANEPAKERTLRWEASEKQHEALAILADHKTTEIVYGGAAGGAKSYLGCAWIVLNMYAYPGCRALLGRAVLKQLKQSTLLTLFEVCKNFGLVKGVDYKYNAQEGVITFSNGSEVFLKDLAHYPSDPDYDSLGSTEYTFAFIDEASQIREKAKNVVKSRLRYKLNEFNIIPKVLMTCNPAKNFLYSEFYKPWKRGELPSSKAFLPARVQDNPWLPKSYIEALGSLDKVSRERLLHGNWEYDDDPAALMDIDHITDIFTNEVEGQNPGKDARGEPLPDTRERYLVADIARFGGDRTVITIWKGLECVAIFIYKKVSTRTTANLIRQHIAKYGIPMSHVLIDEDGIGGGVLDNLPGAKGFIANSRPFKSGKENYQSLKAQCAYALARAVQQRRLGVRVSNPELKESIIEELEQIKAKDIDQDRKLAIVPKDAVREALGRSPDISDCLMMRMYFEYKPKARLTFL